MRRVGESEVRRVVFAGGGTGGHIYPGIAVADSLLALSKKNNVPLEIYWIGSRSGMDRTLVEKNLSDSGGSITAFYGIPCGKLRRYFSLQNLVDLFRIAAGFFRSVALLMKIRPDFLFSKGGFVSVPPCRAARFLGIPYFTHECDFTLGLATKLNSGAAKKILVSYERTAEQMPVALRSRCLVTGNPVRPVFYTDRAYLGREFLGLPSVRHEGEKPILLVLGGSLGARQINNLVMENLDWLTERFMVVHQTGNDFANENADFMSVAHKDYKPYAFIFNEMPFVLQAADIVLSRSGANTLWECAVCGKPMVLVPLCGSGTRGDQVDNAMNAKSLGAAQVLLDKEVSGENLRSCLERLLDAGERERFAGGCARLSGHEVPSQTIAELVLEEVR
ncbi:MAG: UDP-N-acetylglucosamine--N-acetylmuramyl-(pentapeptide) pyrophosphoryl-undecaprenol N-acetylglucosamine transferase [Treponema sp.]|nr:UDP-N-acetylglucosamine--N-acetylmuramyl-(pentapeptide) pyrophosphoryl-undecaprenol N-acetylglucosamine transferase [Treponema sp.]